MTSHERSSDQDNGPSFFLLRRPKIALLLGIIILVWGMLSTIAIPKESAPYIQFGIVSITTIYSGASAEDVDNLVTREIEQKIKNISGINRFSSVSQEGVSQITIELTPEASQDMTKIVGDIRSKVEEARPFLPEEVEDDPRILEIDSSLEPFLTVVLSGDMSSPELTDRAEELQEKLENLRGVARAEIQQGVEREIEVLIDEQKRESYGLSLDQIIQSIRTTHRDSPLGKMTIHDLEYPLRISGKYVSTEDVAKTTIANIAAPGAPPSFLRISDVAEVREVPADTHTISRFSELRNAGERSSFWKKAPEFFQNLSSSALSGSTALWLFPLFLALFWGFFPPRISGISLPRSISWGFFLLLAFCFFLFFSPEKPYSEGEKTFHNAVSLSLSRKSGEDILAAQETAKTEVFAFAQQHPDLRIGFLRDMGEIMREDYLQVLTNALQSVLIVMLFLFLFIGFREGLVASLIIPLAFLSTIGVLGAMGSTLNFMTNFSMILSLGILVDNAIVIVEGVHFFLKKGYSPKEAALLSFREFRAPLISGTLTTVAVFIPLLTLSGILGQYLKFIPVTVIIVMLCSLAIALLLLPSYSASLLPSANALPQHRPSSLRKFLQAFREAFEKKIDVCSLWYIGGIRFLLQKRSRRMLVIGLPIVLFFASTLFPIRFVLFPGGDQPFIQISLEMPEGTTEEKTFASTLAVEEALLGFLEIQSIQTVVSGKSASFSLELLPLRDREDQGLLSSEDLESVLNKELEKIPRERGASLRVEAAQNGPPSEFPVAIRVIAEDHQKIKEAQNITETLTEMMQSIPGTAGVKNDIEKIPGAFEFRILRDRAIALGVPPESIATTLRTALSGVTAATITRNDRDIDIIVRLPEQSLNSPADLEHFSFSLPGRKEILLSQIVEWKTKDSLATIRRQDGALAFTVSSLLGDDGNAAEITAAFLEKQKNVPLPEGISLLTAGENEENAELFADLSRGYVLALFFMFFILVVQFNCFLQPILILFTIILAQIGVQFGLWITDTPKSLAYILGVVALAGVVVNDAIILVDRMNHNRERRKAHESRSELIEAIVESGHSRFVAVLLTTVTTVAGILPLVFQDEFWAGLSYTIIFGLFTATFLTLLVTPLLYFQFEREKNPTFLFIGATLAGIFAFLQMLSGNIFGALLLLFTLLALAFWIRFLYSRPRYREEI